MQELDEKHKDLKDLTVPWFARVREHTDRPEVLGALQTMITTADKFLKQVWMLSEDTVEVSKTTGFVLLIPQLWSAIPFRKYDTVS